MGTRAEDASVRLSDDLVNRVLNSAWRAGLLEFSLNDDALQSLDSGPLGISRLRVHVSGMLPPVVSDCNAEGRPRLHVGDLRVTADLLLLGQPVRARMYVSLQGGLFMRATPRRLRLVLTDVEWVDGELELQPADVPVELLAGLLRQAVVPMVAEELSGAVLAEVSLSAGALVAAGEGAPLGLEASRAPGATVIRATPAR